MTQENEQLQDAAASNNLSRVKQLLADGVDPNAYSPGDNSPLILATMSGRQEIVGALIEAGADLDFRGENRYTALMHASSKGNVGVAQMLLNAGADPDILGYNGNTALTIATRGHNERCVTALLEARADPNIADNDRETPLHYAAQNDKPQMVEQLLAKGAKHDSVNSSGFSPLCTASRYGKIGAARALLDGGADINLASVPSKNTPLQVAVMNRQGNMAEMLVAAGADVTIKNDSGRMARDMTKDRGMKKMLRAAERGNVPSIVEPARPRPTFLVGMDDELFGEMEAPATLPEPKAILGEFTRRLVETNSGLRAEHDALETLLQGVIAEKFLSELVYRETIGAEQLDLLDGAGASLTRRYGNGPTPEWKMDAWIDEGKEDLHRALELMTYRFAEKLGVENQTQEHGQKGISSGYQEDLDEVVEAFNAMLSEPISKIDMTELRAAAKAEAQQTLRSQQDMGR